MHLFQILHPLFGLQSIYFCDYSIGLLCPPWTWSRETTTPGLPCMWQRLKVETTAVFSCIKAKTFMIFLLVRYFNQKGLLALFCQPF